VQESAYELNWERSSGARNRDLLYIARDRALAERAGKDEDLHSPSPAQFLDRTVEQARIAPRLNSARNAKIHTNHRCGCVVVPSFTLGSYNRHDVIGTF
jgi:hypothetical protein